MTRGWKLGVPPAWPDWHTQTTRFTHDCVRCCFLGQLREYDLYWCPGDGRFGSLLGRYGSEGSEYSSGPYEVVYDNPRFCAELQHALARFSEYPTGIQIRTAYQANKLLAELSELVGDYQITELADPADLPSADSYGHSSADDEARGRDLARSGAKRLLEAASKGEIQLDKLKYFFHAPKRAADLAANLFKRKE